MDTSDDRVPIEDLELTFGHLDGRRVWFVSDGTVIPWIGGGDGDDDAGDDDGDDGGGEDGEGDAGDDDEDETLADIANVAKSLGLSPAQLKGRLEASKKWERRAKDNKAELDRLRNRGAGDQDDDAEQVREQVRTEERSRFAARSVEVYLDAQVEAGRITDDQAERLLDSIDATKFIDEDGDVDTDKVKDLLKVIAKPATGNGGKQDLDTGQGRRNGSRRKGEKKSYAAGRDLFEERHGAKTKTN